MLPDRVFMYKIFFRTICSNDIIFFIEEIESKIKKNCILNQLLRDNKLTILLDNAAIHRTNEFKSKMSSLNINLFYNKPYSPEFNCVELLFNKIKSDISTLRVDNLNNRIKKFEEAIESIKPEECLKYYAHSVKIIKNEGEKLLDMFNYPKNLNT